MKDSFIFSLIITSSNHFTLAVNVSRQPEFVPKRRTGTVSVRLLTPFCGLSSHEPSDAVFLEVSLCHGELQAKITAPKNVEFHHGRHHLERIIFIYSTQYSAGL